MTMSHVTCLTVQPLMLPQLPLSLPENAETQASMLPRRTWAVCVCVFGVGTGGGAKVLSVWTVVPSTPI